MAKKCRKRKSYRKGDITYVRGSNGHEYKVDVTGELIRPPWWYKKNR